ncbi:hypothetical protein OS493_030499 [Desmophyllum pertusum]|uniref:Hexosyltransferase n=1 Tax=Desmophyllum pertusum TaxID=174260 RepID=A0A9W9YL99_9CNID|nr:hypothetical protein OS493_030499 [Desmophyllum pertusum]
MLSSSASLKSSYDFHKTRTPVVVNYTEADIPWVAIDCNLFMPWQINQRRIPCTFPPVTAKELSMKAKQAQEAAAKNSNKKKKKKGKKKNKGKGKGRWRRRVKYLPRPGEPLDLSCIAYTPNEEGINVELPAASAEHEHKASFTRDDDSGITAAVSKEDVSIDEAVTNCKQLKNRTTVSTRERSSKTSFETNVTKRTSNGRRIFGYIHPPITGDFVFAISSADGSELWLSTDDDPKHSRKIAYVGNIRRQEKFITLKFFKSKSETNGKCQEKENLEIIESQYLSQYIDYSADKTEITARVLCIGKDHPTLPFAFDEFMTREKYDMRDDFHFRVSTGRLLHVDAGLVNTLFIPTVETLPHSEVSDVLPSCPYNPSYLVSRKLNENEAFKGNLIRHPRVFPDDRTDINMSHDINNHISWGNKKLQKNETLEIVSLYMDALSKKKGDRFTLKEIVNVEAKDDKNKGARYLLELELEDKNKGRSVRLSEYVFRPKENNTIVCYPDGFQWRRNVTVSMIITVYYRNSSTASWRQEKATRSSSATFQGCVQARPEGNQHRHLDLADASKTEATAAPRREVTGPQEDQTSGRQTSYKLCLRAVPKKLPFTCGTIYKRGDDRNFFLIIMDFNSSDVDLIKLREKSGIKDRIVILEQFTEFYKTKALNDGVRYVKDPNSIIFTADLHMRFPANIFDVIRKHTIQGRSFYSPAVLKLKCGYSITHQQAYWEMMGYGLFGGYKSDWDKFEGMDEVKFTTRWGGEDWDLMDRAIGANLEIERLRLPKFYHYFHERKSDWYENARL